MSGVRTRAQARRNESQANEDVLAPRTQKPEFGGFWGALFVTVTVPVTVYYLNIACSEELGCSLSLPVTRPHDLAVQTRRVLKDGFTDKLGWGIYFAWYAFVVLAWFLIPAKWEQGLPLRTGERLEYKINAFRTGVVALLAAGLYIFVYGPERFTVLYQHWPGLLSAALTNSIVQAVWVYLGSFQRNKLLALGGNTGNVLFDWFIGRELNPRIGSFDFKTFNELRPGLILWVLFDISCMCQQYVHFGLVTDSMILVVLFHSWYAYDALYFEPIILTQMDITTDGFGFMLSVGDLAWLPFTYSLQAKFLAFSPVHLGALGVLGVLAIQLLGFYIFRDANNEKNMFRRGENPRSTSSGLCCTLLTLQTFRPCRLRTAASSSCPAGGDSASTRTTWATGSWAGPGACRAASPHPSPTFTWCTLPHCSATGSCGTTKPAGRSTAPSTSLCDGAE